MQTLTSQEEGACVETEMFGEQPLPSCRTTKLNSPDEKRRDEEADGDAGGRTGDATGRAASGRLWFGAQPA